MNGWVLWVVVCAAAGCIAYLVVDYLASHN